MVDVGEDNLRLEVTLSSLLHKFAQVVKTIAVAAASCSK